MFKTISCLNIKDFKNDNLKKIKSLNDLQKYVIKKIDDEDDDWSMCYFFE